MDLLLLFGFVAAVFTFLASPGPVTLLVVNNAAKSFSSGFFTIAGTNLASLILIFISYLVIQSVFKVNVDYLTILQFLGSLYLLYFAFTMLREVFADGALPADNAFNKKKTNKKYFYQGCMVGISNPKDILFFTAFFPLFLGVTENVNTSFILLTVVWVVLDYIILSVFCFFSGKLLSNKYVNYIEILSAIVLFLIAGIGLYYSVLELVTNSTSKI